MCCGKGPKVAKQRWKVKLENGIEIVKSSETEAKAYANSHPNADGTPAHIEKA